MPDKYKIQNSKSIVISPDSFVQLPTVQLLAFLPYISYFYPTHFIRNDLHNDVR